MSTKATFSQADQVKAALQQQKRASTGLVAPTNAQVPTPITVASRRLPQQPQAQVAAAQTQRTSLASSPPTVIAPAATTSAAVTTPVAAAGAAPIPVRAKRITNHVSMSELEDEEEDIEANGEIQEMVKQNNVEQVILQQPPTEDGADGKIVVVEIPVKQDDLPVTQRPFPKVENRRPILFTILGLETAMTGLLIWAAFSSLNSASLTFALIIKLIMMVAVIILYVFSERIMFMKHKRQWNTTESADTERMKALVEHSNLMVRAMAIMAVLMLEFVISLFIAIYALSLQGQIVSHVSELSDSLLALFILIIIIGAALFIAGVVGILAVMHAAYKTTDMICDFFNRDSRRKIKAQEQVESLVQNQIYSHYNNTIEKRFNPANTTF